MAGRYYDNSDVVRRVSLVFIQNPEFITSFMVWTNAM